MKAKIFLVAGLSALMLGACSEDSTLGAPQVQEPGQTVFKDGVMNINLKFAGNESARVRSWGDQNGPANSDFEDGTNLESKVTKVTAYYFKNDQSNTFLARGEATSFSEKPGDASNIEKKITVAVPANVTAALKNNNDKVNVIIVLNEPNDLSPDAESKTFTAFNQAYNNVSFTGDKDNLGFMMSSSLYSQDANNLTTMVKFMEITNEHVAEVGQTPAKTATAYVERVCSRVDLTVNQTVSQTALFDLKGWVLNVRNTKVFPVKNITQATTSLQLSQWPGADDWTNANAAGRYRCYWAEDPNYDNNTQTSDFTKAKFSEMRSLTEKPSYYCLENTMDYGQQKQDQTTTAVVYATYIPKKFAGEAKDHDWGQTTDKTWAVIDNLYYTWDVYIGNFLTHNKIYIQTQDNGWKTATVNDVEITKSDEVTVGNNVVIGYKTYAIALKQGTTLYQKTGEGTTENDFTAISEKNVQDKLKTPFASWVSRSTIYPNGYCYYEIPIQHFTAYEVPFDKEKWNGIYTQAHLGRYGVVRNHIYKLKISKVIKPGKPIKEEVINPSTDPDDPMKKHAMTVDINVLKWAVRTQDVEL